jgi:hypothetical protein
MEWRRAFEGELKRSAVGVGVRRAITTEKW